MSEEKEVRLGSFPRWIGEEKIVGRMSTVQRANFSTKIWPFGTKAVEMGWVHVTDFLANIRVNFKTPFSGSPGFLQGKLGFIYILGIRIPAPMFIIAVDEQGFNILSVVTDGWLSYLAWQL